MKTSLAHLLVNIRDDNFPFYQELMAFLGWPTIHSDKGILGVGDDACSIWFSSDQVSDHANDYDGAGINHIGLGAQSIADVDSVVEYMAERSIMPLFDTPRHRPEFSADEASTYYQVMFEPPDRLLVEVVYNGPK